MPGSTDQDIDPLSPVLPQITRWFHSTGSVSLLPAFPPPPPITYDFHFDPYMGYGEELGWF